MKAFGLFVAVFSVFVLLSGIYQINFTNGIPKNEKYKIVELADDDVEFLEDENILKVDCRGHNSFRARRLKGSINISIKDVVENPDKVLAALNASGKTKICLYCGGSACDVASDVANYLVYTGYEVSVYRPGWPIIRELGIIEGGI